MSYEQGSQATVGAHRISWMLHRGPIPDGMYVCHRCDVRECVNPDHLFVGTSLDNWQDMDAKGRAVLGRIRRGEESGAAKVTEAAVLDMRLRRMPQKKYAALYGICQAQVRGIQNRRSWKWL